MVFGHRLGQRRQDQLHAHAASSRAVPTRLGRWQQRALEGRRDAAYALATLRDARWEVDVGAVLVHAEHELGRDAALRQHVDLGLEVLVAERPRGRLARVDAERVLRRCCRSLSTISQPMAGRWREGELFGFVLRRAARGEPMPYHRVVAEAAASHRQET